jgi:hypothetical protein
LDQRELDGLLTKVTAEARQQEQAAIAELRTLALEVGPERLFTSVMVMLTLVRPGSATEATHGTVSVKIELLAYHLFPLFGTPPNGPLRPQAVERTFTLLNSLLTLYVQGNSFQEEAGGSSLSPNLKALVGHLLIDTRVVRGSAYPEQTMEEISEVQGHFEEWFSNRVGIGPRRAIELLVAVLRAEEDLGNEWRFKLRDGRLLTEKAWKEARRTKKSDLTPEQQTLLSIAQSPEHATLLGYTQTLANVPPDDVSVPRELARLSPQPTVDEWQGLIALIGCTPETRTVMHDPVEMQQRPLFVLPGKRLLLCDISNAVDQLWRAFEDIARQDQSFYSGAYQQHRGQWLEDRLAALVQRVFPTGTIYRKLTYPDPDRGQGATAELDAAIHWPPFLIVMEAKAAQFRFASQLGDLGRLKSDVKANVTDAFEQARRATRYVQSVPEAVFLENSTGRTLVVRRDEIQRTYLITVSLHHLAGIATRLASIQGLGLFGDDEYPWAISVADLDLMTQFCPGPDVFLHYAERRLAIQRDVVKIQADEVDLFGAYLKTRLQANRIWEREGMKKPDWVSLSGFQEPFDAVMDHRRGHRKDAPQIRLEIPQEVEDVLQELRRHESDKDARWIAFRLLSLSDRALEIVARMFRDLRSQSLNADAFRRITHTEGDLAISVVATKGHSPDALLRNTESRTLLEKYRRKCTTSIGFGVLVSDRSKPFQCAAWAECPWAHDPEMVKLIETEAAPTPSPGSKIPGRNDPCLCGSTKKFKKCCLPKMDASRRS